MRRALAVAAIVAVSGCATPQHNAATAGQPPAYQTGYQAGCNSGFVAAGHPYYRFSKDVAAYGADQIYRQGWDDGFRVCKGQYDAMGQALQR